MKIIEKGDPRGKIPKWVGKTISCECGMRAVLEFGDEVKVQSDQRDGTFLHVTCPTCKKTIYVGV